LSLAGYAGAVGHNNDAACDDERCDSCDENMHPLIMGHQAPKRGSVLAPKSKTSVFQKRLVKLEPHHWSLASPPVRATFISCALALTRADSRNAMERGVYAAFTRVYAASTWKTCVSDASGNFDREAA